MASKVLRLATKGDSRTFVLVAFIEFVVLAARMGVHPRISCRSLNPPFCDTPVGSVPPGFMWYVLKTTWVLECPVPMVNVSVNFLVTALYATVAMASTICFSAVLSVIVAAIAAFKAVPSAVKLEYTPGVMENS